MNIGTVAERSGVSPKAIRYYESIGLVRPADRRANGYRSYTLADMRTLDFIKRARSLGFSVEEVRELLDLWQNRSRRSASVKALTSRHLEALDRKIEELTVIRKALADLVGRCHGDARPDCPILDDFEHGEELPHKAASPVEQRPRSRKRKETS
jgi:MerR family transcriptional regulator, copper efflux regulator